MIPRKPSNADQRFAAVFTDATLEENMGATPSNADHRFADVFTSDNLVIEF